MLKKNLLSLSIAISLPVAFFSLGCGDDVPLSKSSFAVDSVYIDGRRINLDDTAKSTLKPKIDLFFSQPVNVPDLNGISLIKSGVSIERNINPAEGKIFAITTRQPLQSGELYTLVVENTIRNTALQPIKQKYLIRFRTSD